MSLNFGKGNLSIAYNPTSAFPVDARTYFESYNEALAKAQTAEEVGSTNTKYHYGMKLLVKEGETYTWYKIVKKSPYLEAEGSGGGSSGDSDSDSTDNGTIDYTTVWEIVDTPDCSSLPQTYAERIQISFTSNERLYSGIRGDHNQIFYYLGSSSRCVYDGRWEDEGVHRTITIHEKIADASFLDWLYQNATLLSGSVDGIIIRDGDKTDKMPTIRFVSFRNILGSFMFSVEIIGGGKLHLGDYLELCAMRTCKRPESDRKAWQKRQRLRRLHRQIIKDTSKNLLTLSIPYEEAGQLFKNDRNGTTDKIGCRSPIYLRIKRPFFDDGGNENYAKFSNVIRLEKSYSISDNTITIK